MAQRLKNLSVMQKPQKMWFWFLIQKDPFKKEAGNLLLYSCFKNLWTEEHGGLLVQRGVQFSRSVMSNSLQPHGSQHSRPPCSSPSPGVHSDSTSIESVMPSSHLILVRPLLLLPPIPPSIRVFSNESTLHMRWPKYWSFSFSISPSKDLPGLISFRMD